MLRRQISQESFGFGAEERSSSVDALGALIDCTEPEALLLAGWHDASDPRLAEVLDDRSSFPLLCGFSRFEPTPKRTAFVRFRR